MMHVIAAIFVIVGVVTVLLASWMIVCNERTFRQRTRLIMALPVGDSSYRKLSDEFDRVSYESHLFALAVFRDPRKLYGPLTQERWK